MIKLIASDIDGTLVPESSCTINPEFYETVRELKRQGILFVAASGRQYSSIHTLFAPIAEDVAFIAGNGVHVMYPDGTEDNIWMNRKDVEEAVAYLRELPDCLFTVSDSRCIYLEKRDADFEKLLVEGYHNHLCPVKDVLGEPIGIQKMAIYKKTGVQDLLESVKGAWEEKFRVFQAGERWIDMVDYGADKGKALRKIQKMYGILPEETMAFGDNYNDIGMLQAAEESYAVKSAPKGVQMAAKHLADSYETEGVIRILKALAEENRRR